MSSDDNMNLVWVLPDSRPDSYPGSWPLEFEEKLLTLYGFDYTHPEIKEQVVQLFSGGVKYGFKVDLLHDPNIETRKILSPDYCGDAHQLPNAWTERWDMCICDPPYTSNWSRVLYGTSQIIYSKYISEAVRIVRPGGFVASYHWSATPVPDTCILHRRILVIRDYFKKLRLCTVFQKRN